MATIKSQLSLDDGMSAVLNKITFALDTTLGAFEQMQRASEQAIDVGSIEKARGLLVEANADFERMANEMAKAAREQERLNRNIERGASAADGMLKKVISIVGAYASVSAVKGFATSAMEAADVQIGAQVQLRTVLDNMGASDIDAMTGSAPVIEPRVEAAQAISAYDAIVQKAAEIQSQGMYGDEAMIAGAAELATYFSDTTAMGTTAECLPKFYPISAKWSSTKEPFPAALPLFASMRPMRLLLSGPAWNLPPTTERRGPAALGTSF